MAQLRQGYASSSRILNIRSRCSLSRRVCIRRSASRPDSGRDAFAGSQGMCLPRRARNEPWSRVTVVPLPELPGVSYQGAA